MDRKVFKQEEAIENPKEAQRLPGPAFTGLYNKTYCMASDEQTGRPNARRQTAHQGRVHEGVTLLFEGDGEPRAVSNRHKG